MVLFHSMWSVSAYTAFTAFLLIWLGAAINPFAASAAFIRSLVGVKRYAWHFIALILILFCNKMELRIEQQMLSAYDFTSMFHALEGNIVHTIQLLFRSKWLTAPLAFMYVVVFQAMMLSSLAVYTVRAGLSANNGKLYYATCYSIMLNYFIAIPFFLFFPVNEVWSYEASGVSFLMLEAFPAFETQYRLLSGLDNCFPSLHTSISVTLAILACYSDNRRWAAVVCACSAVILFSILYLGIHWVTDMAGGITLGIAASVAGLKLSEWSVYAERKPVI
ncbi:phosphatase PAP2 family protein [Paenibacillus sp. NEAU-GSW1]|uniref:phosphatase PAP2 family protein n=1 Tax=Paenibacillus sp. NEAU-GSW1 TaxID=2682486 RepID=UPI0012E27CA8|nr:phosphatase PAP2 family protein [Paenibacillus sp. NEAU-GSW1]MUT67287.1 phosphatase PAP2 family protein [Paenibacillus sp. NEAU-GSW1]